MASVDKTTETQGYWGLTFPHILYIIFMLLRCVAQLGRALRSGRRGRGFESRRIDKKGFCPLGQKPFFIDTAMFKFMTSRGAETVGSNPTLSSGASARPPIHPL